jgi:general secretion pathway protein C
MSTLLNRPPEILLKHWPGLASIVLLAILSLLLAQWTWVFLAPKAKPNPLTGVAAIDNQASAKIIGAQLFGPLAQNRAPAASVPVAATPLNIRLKGIYAPLGRFPAFAILNAEGKDQSVRVGGEVMPGVELVAVHARYAVIRRQGRLERVELDEKASAGGPIAAAVRQSGSRTAVAPAAAPPANQFRLNVQPAGANTAALSRSELTSALQDVQQLSNLGRVGTNPGGGILVEDVPPGSLAEKLGLHQGDVLKQVNGQSVNSNEDLTRLYQESGQAGQIKLQGTRGGRPLVLNFTIQP